MIAFILDFLGIANTPENVANVKLSLAAAVGAGIFVFARWVANSTIKWMRIRSGPLSGNWISHTLDTAGDPATTEQVGVRHIGDSVFVKARRVSPEEQSSLKWKAIGLWRNRRFVGWYASTVAQVNSFGVLVLEMDKYGTSMVGSRWSASGVQKKSSPEWPSQRVVWRKSSGQHGVSDNGD